MFHPVGAQPPTVYWRRRLVLFASIAALVVLVVLTAAALGGGDGKASADSGSAGSSSSSAAMPSHSSALSSASSTQSLGSSESSSAAHSSSGASPSSSTSAPPKACTAKSLDVAAATARSSYKVGAQPVLEMQVTNVGAQPCVQDLADKQVELRVYNGESRVWGSHDCKVQPGSMTRTLAPKVAVKIAINWSGLTSQHDCRGTRQRVGAGSYTLYALLAGREGKAAQFSIS